eukprot:CAMPEP_0175123854 /NCGR_PEP_ID=MMETSP0087-20121206/2468_1 /TAXON_ID=136419 /ORGANISM="Unknown Unknown, Strain D1" /LENGTH=306 /DNA_ID=CAMNT_0016405579 /DNA_START=56 /DNA_END=976 /DNA_ORIENTATION=-
MALSAASFLHTSFYFDFQKHPFEHMSLFEGASHNVVDTLDNIGPYTRTWLKNRREESNSFKDTAEEAKQFSSTITTGQFLVYLEPGAIFAPSVITGCSASSPEIFYVYVSKGTRLIGCSLDLSNGSIYLGVNNSVEAFSGLIGPAIFGHNNSIRQGAYFRGQTVIGDNGVFRGELKNVVVMNGAQFPHPSYLGDSICGYKSHFGNQVTTANISIFDAVSAEPKPSISVTVDGKKYDFRRRKMGAIIGDESQVGCNSVIDPGTFVGLRSVVYSLTRLNRGVYGPNELIKNKPLEKGVLERGPLRVDQ